ncbi:transposase [Streptosporangium sp. OZ121]|uniref:transposase n=1 Tax=Streptosporangium sp. OZ121 TaxID=3444183 RepID=UPI003F7993B9
MSIFEPQRESRDLDFIVAVRSDESAHPHDAVPTTPAWSGNGRKPAARYRCAASSLRDLAAEPSRAGQATGG